MANSTKISLNSVISVAANQVSCELEGEAAILNLTSGAYHGLNPVGLAIWNLIAKPLAVRDVVSAIVDEYDVDRTRCEHDLLALFTQLDERGLIEITDGPGG